MSADGESRLRVVVVTCSGASAHRRVGRQPRRKAPRARSPPLERRGRRTWQCPHSAEGDMRAL